MAGLRGKALVAYLVVCVFWGRPTLAIRVGVGVLPPFLFAGLRFLIAGLLLLTVVLALATRYRNGWSTADPGNRGCAAAGGREMRSSSGPQQYNRVRRCQHFRRHVALWMAFFDAIIPGGSGDLNWRVVTGLLLGFLGTALLVGATRRDPAGRSARTDRPHLRERVVVARSVYSKRHRTETSPYVGAAIQMIAGGAAINRRGHTAQ